MLTNIQLNVYRQVLKCPRLLVGHHTNEKNLLVSISIWLILVSGGISQQVPLCVIVVSAHDACTMSRDQWSPLRPSLGEFLLQSIPLFTASISSTTEKLWTTQALLFLRNREASSCLGSPSATYHALSAFDKIYLAHRCFYALFFSFHLSNKTQHECDCYGKWDIITFFFWGGGGCCYCQ